jgi:hypothetical protein
MMIDGSTAAARAGVAGQRIPAKVGGAFDGSAFSAEALSLASPISSMVRKPPWLVGGAFRAAPVIMHYVFRCEIWLWNSRILAECLRLECRGTLRAWLGLGISAMAPGVAGKGGSSQRDICMGPTLSMFG